MPVESFKVLVGERTVEVTVDAQTVTIDGRPVAVSLQPSSPGHYSLLVDGHSMGLSVESAPADRLRLRTASAVHDVEVLGRREQLLRAASGSADRAARHEVVRAPMPGLIVKVHVSPGDRVRSGDALLVLEAMKMENEIRAAHDAVIARVHVRPADAVLKNAPLIEFEAS